MPQTLFVSSPNFRQQCAGEYTLFEWEKPHGHPLWKHKDGECWLYTSMNGRWIIGGTDAKQKNFECSTGYIASQKLHHGSMPQSFNGTWEVAKWNEDPDITVRCAGDDRPGVYIVNSPNGRQGCSGEYELVVDELPHGQPLWKQTDGGHWLYSGSKGTWIIGGAEERRDNFCCSSGVIVCAKPHEGSRPDAVSGTWWWTGRSLDDSIRVTAWNPADEEADDSSSFCPACSVWLVFAACMVLTLLVATARWCD